MPSNEKTIALMKSIHTVTRTGDAKTWTRYTCGKRSDFIPVQGIVRVTLRLPTSAAENSDPAVSSLESDTLMWETCDDDKNGQQLHFQFAGNTPTRHVFGLVFREYVAVMSKPLRFLPYIFSTLSGRSRTLRNGFMPEPAHFITLLLRSLFLGRPIVEAVFSPSAVVLISPHSVLLEYFSEALEPYYSQYPPFHTSENDDYEARLELFLHAFTTSETHQTLLDVVVFNIVAFYTKLTATHAEAKAFFQTHGFPVEQDESIYAPMSLQAFLAHMRNVIDPEDIAETRFGFEISFKRIL